MVSDFIEQHDGFLRITGFQAQYAGLPSTARVRLEYGAEKEGYWNSERFISNVNTGLRRRGTGIASDSSATLRMQSRLLYLSTHQGGTH